METADTLFISFGFSEPLCSAEVLTFGLSAGVDVKGLHPKVLLSQMSVSNSLDTQFLFYLDFWSSLP